MSDITINYDSICIFRTSEKAWAVTWGDTRSDRDKSLVFLPKNMVQVDEVARTITLPEWLAVEKGIECYDVG
tara:strand:+ start:307 stop:522 length:216 start_codon:yes stop_codon:yes gene_type:complete